MVQNLYEKILWLCPFRVAFSLFYLPTVLPLNYSQTVVYFPKNPIFMVNFPKMEIFIGNFNL
jgi:hypothetical protein